MNVSEISALAARLAAASNAYHNGLPLLMTDDEFDAGVEILRAVAPDHLFLTQVGATVAARGVGVAALANSLGRGVAALAFDDEYAAAADKGHAESAFILAGYLAMGGQAMGGPKGSGRVDKTAARKWARRAIELGWDEQETRELLHATGVRL
jgi:hypothetical protein